jgi:hypothetical protein
MDELTWDLRLLSALFRAPIPACHRVAAAVAEGRLKTGVLEEVVGSVQKFHGLSWRTLRMRHLAGNCPCEIRFSVRNLRLPPMVVCYDQAQLAVEVEAVPLRSRQYSPMKYLELIFFEEVPCRPLEVEEAGVGRLLDLRYSPD